MNHVLIALVMSVALPHIAETIFAPCIMEIADHFSVPTYQAQWTLSTYLTGYTLGTITWGFVSERFGAKKTLTMALFAFAIANFCSALTEQIMILYLFRILQGFFGAVVSVVPQAYLVHHFSLKQRAIITARIGQAVAIGPAAGPLIGVTLIGFGSWHLVIYALSFFTLLCVALLHTAMPKDNVEAIAENDQKHVPFSLGKTLKKIAPYSVLMGLSISTGFYFFNQSRFFYLDHLGLGDQIYNLACFGVACSWFIGSKLSEHLLKRDVGCAQIIYLGAKICLLSTTLLYLLPLLGPEKSTYANLSSLCILSMMIGTGLQIGNSITLALSQFKQHTGKISSIFALMNYALASLVNYIAPILVGNHLYSFGHTYLPIALILFLFAFNQRQEKLA